MLAMPIHKCLDCNATMKAEETTCWACGSVIKTQDLPMGLSRFVTFINVFFLVSLVATLASIFTDMMPPFMRCAAVTAVLFLVKSSAKQMLDKRKT
jgi:hypothetical protein